MALPWNTKAILVCYRKIGKQQDNPTLSITCTLRDTSDCSAASAPKGTQTNACMATVATFP